MRTNAEKAFRAIGGLGLARCDFFYTDKGRDLLKRTQYHARIYPMVYVSSTLGQYGTQLYRFDYPLVELGKEVFQKHEAHLL